MRHDRISQDPKIMFGKPCIAGTRIPVEMILRKLGAGMSEAEFLTAYPHITAEDVRAAFTYAAAQLALEDIVFASPTAP